MSHIVILQGFYVAVSPFPREPGSPGAHSAMVVLLNSLCPKPTHVTHSHLSLGEIPGKEGHLVNEA